MTDFEAAIDHAHDAASSVVLRYRKAFPPLPDEVARERLDELLLRASQGEGVQVVRLLEYRGVELHVLDESSLMRTRSLKSIDGCVNAALCSLENVACIVFESGGNTGVALTDYAQRMGIETFCFVPEENLPLLDRATFASPSARLIAVAEPGAVGAAADGFAERHGLTRVPRPGWRILASRFLGAFLLEHLLAGNRYDHLVQSISAAFGPVGVYSVLRGHRERLGRLPRFLGVQQAANCAMVRAYNEEGATAPPVRSTRALLSRVMYDSTPQRHGTLDKLKEILRESDGHLTTVDHEEFSRYLSEEPSPLSELAKKGVRITVRDGEVLEKTGLMALAGTLKEIDAGAIAPGSRVLCCLTGGTADPDGRAVPDARIPDASELASLDRVFGRAARGAGHGGA